MPSGILGNIDVYVLTHTAITIDRINECERQLNENGLLDDKGKPSAYLKMKSNYMKEFLRLCNKLSLSPQSRAKLANINVGVEKNDTINLRINSMLKSLLGRYNLNLL